MYKPIDLLKYEVYVQTDRPLCKPIDLLTYDRPLCKPIDLLTYEVYVQTD